MRCGARVVHFKPSRKIAFELSTGGDRIASDTFELGGDIGKLGNLCNALLARPRLSRRATPRAMDQPDRRATGKVQRAPEEKSHGGELGRGLRGADEPLSADACLRFEREVLSDAEVTDLRKIRARSFGLPVLDRLLALAQPELAFHVGLAAANPDLSDEHVGEFDPVLARDRERMRSAGWQRLKLYAPFAAMGNG